MEQLQKREQLADVLAGHTMTRKELTHALLSIMYALKDNTPADWDKFLAKAKRSCKD